MSGKTNHRREREERLAAELRANLQKRKAQARSRGNSGDATASRSEPAEKTGECGASRPETNAPLPERGEHD